MRSRDIAFQNELAREIGRAVFCLACRADPWNRIRMADIPLRECHHFFYRTQIRASGFRVLCTPFLHIRFAVNVKVTGELNMRPIQIWSISFRGRWWLTIVRHADHDGAIHFLRLGPIPEKQMHKVRWVHGLVNLYLSF